MQGETNADWRMGEHLKNNIMIINEDEKEAIELKHRLQSKVLHHNLNETVLDR